MISFFLGTHLRIFFSHGIGRNRNKIKKSVTNPTIRVVLNMNYGYGSVTPTAFQDSAHSKTSQFRWFQRKWNEKTENWLHSEMKWNAETNGWWIYTENYYHLFNPVCWFLTYSLLSFKFITTQKPWFQLLTLIGNTIFNLNTLAVRTGLWLWPYSR